MKQAFKAFAAMAFAAAVLAPAYAGAALKVGDKVPEFELPMLGGGNFKLTEFLETKKKGLVLAVTQSACASCRTELQFLNNFVGKPGYDVMMINVDAKGGTADHDAIMKAYMAESALKMGVLVDPKMSVPRSWGVYVTPSVLIIDKAGLAVEVRSGWEGDAAKAVSEKLGTLK